MNLLIFYKLWKKLPLIWKVKETTDTASSASFLDLYDSGQLSTKIYDKRNDFNFKIINFTNMCSNIPASPAYGVYISQLIRYARASSNYSDFLKRHLHPRNRLLDQGYKKIRLIWSLKKFIFWYQDLVEIYSVSAEKIISDAFSYRNSRGICCCLCLCLFSRNNATAILPHVFSLLKWFICNLRVVMSNLSVKKNICV
jgi:hypothetical protein